MAHSTDGLCKQGQHRLEAEATQAASPSPPRQDWSLFRAQTPQAVRGQHRLKAEATQAPPPQSSDPLKLFGGQEPSLVGGRRLLSTPHMGALSLPIRGT